MKINDIIAKEFIQYMAKYPELYKNLAITIFEELNNNKNPIILDLGSGPCLINKEISKLLPDSVILSLDASMKMLKNAEKYPYNTKNRKTNSILSIAENIPLKSNSIDILISRFSLSYWIEPEKAILEINRVLKPSGKFVLEALNKNYSKWKLFLIKIHMFLNFAGKNVVKYHIDAYDNAYGIDKIECFLTNGGFNIVKKEGSNKGWKYKIIATKPKI